MPITKNKFYYLALILIIGFAISIIYLFPEKNNLTANVELNKSASTANPEEVLVEE